MAEVGPDGQLWIADWYNYVLQHNAESDRQEPSRGNAYANPLRDRGHGRIYRIVYEGAPPSEPMSLAGAGPEELVRTLRHENRLWRMHAQRLLVERKQTDVVASLTQLVEDPSVDEIGLNAGAIHALWTLHGLGQLDGSNPEALAAARRALRHPSAAVRRNAVKVLPNETASVSAILESDLLNDDDPHVRLAALVALIEMPPTPEAGRAIFSVLQALANREDRWIREAATLAAAVHSGGFLDVAGSAGVALEEIGPDPRTTLVGITEMIRRRDAAAGDLEGENVAGAAPADPADSGEVDVVLEVGVTPSTLRFDQTELRVEAGQRVRIVFKNTDNMEHNLVVIMPGSIAGVGRLADELALSPQGRERNYVPASPDVLASTPIVGPSGAYELTFTAPEEPGEYSFICTIPGHWRSMRGTLIVEPAAPREP